MTTVDTAPVPTPGDGPPDAEAWAHLDLKLGEIRDTVVGDRSRRTLSQPLRAPLERGGRVDANGRLVLDLGGPAMGRRWTVRNLTVSDGADVTTAVTGAANVYVGSPIAFGPGQRRAALAALPGVDQYGSDQLVVTGPDHLIVVVTGSTADQSLIAAAEIQDYPLHLPKAVIPV